MGNANSARVITLANEDPTNVIKVSDRVVQRMKGGAPRKDDVTEDDHPKPTEIAPLPATTDHQPYYLDPLPTSLQVRREKEAVLRNNDAYWQQRIVDIQENHRKISKKLEEEYEAAVAEVAESFKKASSNIKEYPCQDLKELVVKCYQKNSKQPLLCSKEVQTFQKCVQQTMVGLVDGR